MDDRKLLKTGVFGSALVALCCFTPVLVVLLGAVGLSAWLGWIDYVLWPALVVFLGITAYALARRSRPAGPGATDAASDPDAPRRADPRRAPPNSPAPAAGGPPPNKLGNR